MEVSLGQLIAIGVGIVGLAFAHFMRSPNEAFKALEKRVEVLENAHDAFAVKHADSYGRLDETVKHLSTVVGNFDRSLGELRQLIGYRGQHNGPTLGGG